MMQKWSILPFTYIFRGHWDHDVFEGHDGATYRHAPVRSGAGPKIEWAEREWSGQTPERSGSGAGAEREKYGGGSEVVSGGYRKSRERWAEIS